MVTTSTARYFPWIWSALFASSIIASWFSLFLFFYYSSHRTSCKRPAEHVSTVSTASPTPYDMFPDSLCLGCASLILLSPSQVFRQMTEKPSFFKRGKAISCSLAMLVLGMLLEGRGLCRLQECRLADLALDIAGGFILQRDKRRGERRIVSHVSPINCSPLKGRDTFLPLNRYACGGNAGAGGRV